MADIPPAASIGEIRSQGLQVRKGKTKASLQQGKDERLQMGKKEGKGKLTVEER